MTSKDPMSKPYKAISDDEEYEGVLWSTEASHFVISPNCFRFLMHFISSNSLAKPLCHKHHSHACIHLNKMSSAKTNWQL